MVIIHHALVLIAVIGMGQGFYKNLFVGESAEDSWMVSAMCLFVAFLIG